jgi:2-deoxy-D-gluconate 3-dehydrogenase
MTSILDKFDLTDRTAIVTGGAGLLGKEFCRTLAEAGGFPPEGGIPLPRDQN